ncbi:hypothetical protein DFJ73DRAFT_857150 [Zopfochytrium polystomum]|nr:hypothetical protein DFJ73DRAFT_857150 [Zopfochytrium polystomum]
MSELLIQLRDLLVASGAANGADASKKHNDDPAKATGGDEPLSPDNLATCRRLVFMIILSMSPQHGDNRIPSGLFQANCVAILQVTRTMPAVFSHPACVLADSQLCEVPAFGVSQLELQRTPGMTQNSRIREFDSTSVVMFDLWAVERMFSFLGNEAFSNHHDQIRETLMRIFMIHLERQPFSDRCRLLFGFMTDVAIGETSFLALAQSLSLVSHHEG